MVQFGTSMTMLGVRPKANHPTNPTNGPHCTQMHVVSPKNIASCVFGTNTPATLMTSPFRRCPGPNNME